MGVDLRNLGSSIKVETKNARDDSRVKLSLAMITELEMALNSFRNLFPWNIFRDYPDWTPDYSRYRQEYKEIFGLFVRECVIWGLDDKLLMKKYLEKHDINIER